MISFKKGDKVEFKDEYKSASDKGLTFYVEEESTTSGSIKVVARGSGLFIDPIPTVHVDYIQPAPVVIMDAYERGYLAFETNQPINSNPYPFVEVDEDTDHRLFCAGWYDAQDDTFERG
jgi:hypothetical protein